MLSRWLVVLLVAPWLEGCGILAQSIAGWDEVVEVDAPDVAHLTVQTVPIGAQVCREDAAGACAAEGVGPWADEVPVQVHFQRRERRFGWLLLGMVADFAAVGTVIGVADARGDCQSGTCLGLVVGSAVGLMLATMVDMGAFIFGVALEPPQVVGEVRVVAPAAVTYSARRPGYLPARERLQVDLQGVVRLSLEPEAAEVPIAVGFDRAAAVVAVLPLGGDAPEALRAAAQDRLRIKLVGSGLRTADRGLTTAAARDATCPAPPCDLEVGRALAASHLLRAQLDAGEACLLRVELVDLTTEAVVGAAWSEGTCLDAPGLDALLATAVGRLFP